MSRPGRLARFTALALCAWAWTPAPAHAAITIAGTVHFEDLDGSGLDEDPTPGTFGVAGDLVIEGTIECLDAKPLPGRASGCPVSLVAGGDLVIETGGAIVTENRRGSGSGGDVTLEAGGDLVLRGGNGGLPGALVTTERITGANPGGGHRGGHVTLEVAGDVILEAGSVLSAGAQGGTAGSITILAGGRVELAGLVASGPGRELAGNRLDGAVLAGGNAGQAGGEITVVSTSTADPAIGVAGTGIVVSQGRRGGAGAVSLEGCGVEVHGLVVSLAGEAGDASVSLRSGGGLLVDGSDLDRSPAEPTFLGRLGAVRASGAAGPAVSLLARGELTVHGPAIGDGELFAVRANAGDRSGSAGGTVTALSLDGLLTATGHAFQAGRWESEHAGGAVDLQAAGEITLDDAVLEAAGDSGGKAGAGGDIVVQSHQGGVSWLDGIGDVRPVGAGVAATRSGSITVVECAGADLAGSLFPTVGGPVPPFPELLQDCSSPGPELPPGESLPVCNEPPVAQDDDVTTDELSSLSGDVLADNGQGADSDPEGQPLTVTDVNGVAGDVGGLVVLSSGALLTLDADGTFTYDPNGQFEELAPGETALDTFSYTIEDAGGLADSATVRVVITGIDTPPVAVDDTGSTSEDSVLAVVDPGATPSLLANDFDPDGSDVLIVTGFDHPSAQGATVSVHPDGTFSYDPTGVAAFQALRPGETAVDSFGYTLSDGHGGTDAATVTITVLGVNDAPVAFEDLSATVGNTELAAGGAAAAGLAHVLDAINLLANDSDPAEGTALTLIAAAGDVSGPPFVGPTALGGEVTVFGDGSFRYLPPAGIKDRAGETADAFGYTVQDADGGTATGTVSIEIADALVWYVHNDPTDPANPPGGNGRSTDPLDLLSDGPLDTAPDDAEDAAGIGDTLFVFRGDGTTAGQDRGIALVDGQALLGHRAATLVRGGLTIQTPGPGDRPKIANVEPGGDGVSVVASLTAGDRRSIEIRGLEISGADDAVEIRATGSADTDFALTDAVLAAATGAGLEVDGTASGGTVTVTEIAESAVTAAGDGLLFDDVVFDADLEAPGLQPVAAGDVRVGDPASPGDVTGSGLRLNLVRGSLVFGDLDVGNTGGPGLWVRDADGKIGTFALATAGGTVTTVSGTALDVDPVTLSLVFDSLTSVASPGHGINFDTVVGSLLAGSTTVQDAGGTGIRIVGSAASLDFGVATIDQTAGGAAVHLTNSTGTTTFTDLAVTTAASPGIVASNGGTLQVLGTTSTVSTAGAPAIDLATTGLGPGATFADVSSSGSPTTGVDLQSVSGAFTVTGGSLTGAAGPAFRVSGGNSPIAYGGSITNTDGLAVQITGRSGGSVTLSGAVTDDGATNSGVSLAGNGGSISFTGATRLTDTAGPALQVSGGTAAISFADLSIQQTNGRPGVVTAEVAGGSLVLAGDSSVNVSGIGAGIDAVTLDGSGAAFDVAMPIVGLATGAMRHGLVLSDLGAGSDVTIGGGTITSEGAGRRAIHFAGPTAGTFDLSSVALQADESDGIAFGAGETGSYQLGDLDVDDPAGGVGVTVSGSAAAVGFRSIEQAGGVTGVAITGGSGGFAVLGSGAAGSGGTITGLSGDGVHLAGARDVSLSSMVIDGNSGSGIFGDDVDGFALADSVVTDNGDTQNGSEANLRFHEMLGTAQIIGSTISGAFEDNVRLTPASGVLASLTISDSAIGPSSPATGGNGLAILAGGSAVTTVVVTDTTFEGNRGSAVLSNQGGSAVHVLDITGNTFRDNGSAVTLQTSGSADLAFDVVENLEIVRSASNAIQLVAGAGSTEASTIRGTIAGNGIGNGTADSGSRDMFGVALDLRGDQDAVIAVTGNTIRNTDFEGVWVSSADFGANPAQQGRLDLTLRDNGVGTPDDNSAFPLGFVRGVLVDARHTTALCLDMASNASAGVGGGEHFRLRQRDTSTLRLERLTDGDATPGELIASVALVESHVVAENDSGSTADATLVAGFTEATSGYCRKP